MKKLACLLLLLTVGCNRKLKVPKIISIDPAFQAYVNDFVAEAKSQGVHIVIDNLSVHFSSKLALNTLGTCQNFERGEYGTPTIRINIQEWPEETELEREVILFHELGHCVLWRGHVETGVGPNGSSPSIMFPYISINPDSDYVWLNNWTYYMHELFHGS